MPYMDMSSVAARYNVYDIEVAHISRLIAVLRATNHASHKVKVGRDVNFDDGRMRLTR